MAAAAAPASSNGEMFLSVVSMAVLLPCGEHLKHRISGGKRHVIPPARMDTWGMGGAVKFVGRLGGLAVALGIGSALLTWGRPVASVEPGDRRRASRPRRRARFCGRHGGCISSRNDGALVEGRRRAGSTATSRARRWRLLGVLSASPAYNAVQVSSPAQATTQACPRSPTPASDGAPADHRARGDTADAGV